jgi:hypothetical protein
MKTQLLVAALVLSGMATMAQNRQQIPAITPLPPLKSPQQEKIPFSALQYLTSEKMRAGGCYAGSRIEDKKALGGFGRSDNFPHRIGKMPVRKGECYLEVRPKEAAAFAQKYVGIRLLLVNATDRAAAFQACDSRLSIVQEALDAKGKWRPIEFLQSSGCGNSYHHVFLGSGEYWTLAIPRYEGTLKTRMRVRLETGKKTILSNEFEGSVNPGQFVKGKEPFQFVPSPPE